MRIRNQLWQPTKTDLHVNKQKNPPKTIHDPICEHCNNDNCVVQCAPLVWIDGNVSRKEPLISDMVSSDYNHGDYKDALTDLQQHQMDRIEALSAIANSKRKAIAALLTVGFTRNDISVLLSMSHRQIVRIIKKSNT